MAQSKIYGLEILKFLAALMITNSHFKLLYPLQLSALGTLGAPGNALFFFISGYALMLGHQSDFSSWYQRRLKRLWVSPFIYATILAPLFLSYDIKMEDIWLGGNFWFIKCIAVYYILFYMIRKFGMKLIKLFIIISMLISVAYFMMMDVTPHSIYITNFHYVSFFSIMLLGAYCGDNNTWGKNKDSAAQYFYMVVISLVLFYAIQFVGKGFMGGRYYLQIVSLIPLHMFVYSIYRLVLSPSFSKLFERKIIVLVVRTVAALTLEIYIIGFHFVYMTQLNNLFPLNIVIVGIILLFAAYILKVLSNIFLQFMSNTRINWKICFSLFQ